MPDVNRKPEEEGRAGGSRYVHRLAPYSGRLWRERTPRIGHLDIELTERCNNNCIHCSINRPLKDARARSRELNTGQWKNIIREVADLGVITIRFTGGEPTVREDFNELYRFTREQGIKVILFTNARNITPRLADLLARIPPLEKVEVSVYGMHRKSCEAVTRSPGSFGEFQRGVRRLGENRIPFRVKGVLLPPTRSETGELEKWARTLTGMKEGPAFSLFFELRSRRDWEEKNRQILSLRIPPEEGVRFMARHDPQYAEEMSRFCRRFLGPPGPRLFNCNAGISGCIDAYGQYQPCLSLRAPHLVYDLGEGSMRDALEGFFPGLKNMTAENPAYLNRCSRCFLQPLCRQCPALSWTEHGTLDTPVEYFCRVTHAQARYLGLLEEKERAWEVEDWRCRVEGLLEESNE